MENYTSTELEASRGFDVARLAAVLSDALQLSATTPLVVAYSGGLDSHVLLHALARLRDTATRALRAVHVNHNLHADASRWASHCAQVCAALDIPFEAETVAVQHIGTQGLEQAARRARYSALARMLRPEEVLLTAHHRDDQAETVLLQLLRGGSVRGLAGMPAITSFARGRLARPLLHVGRSALAAYAASEGLRYLDDPSNEDKRIARNYIRYDVFPRLNARWPDASEQLARAARRSAEVAELVDEIAADDLARCALAAGELHVPALATLSASRRGNLVRYWLRRHGVRVPSEAVVSQILARCTAAPRTRQARITWPEAEVRRYRDALSVSVRDDVPETWTASWDPVAPLLLPGTGKRLRATPATGTGLARIWMHDAPWRVQWRRGGERCRLPGRSHRHKLKKLLQDAGVPPWERERLPLVYVDGELAAIGDRWVCQPYAARADEPSVTLVIESAT